MQLITYPDSLGGNLAGLRKLLSGSLAGLFGGVHILPPFPSTGDRGFSPRTYQEIDASFGSWDDLRAIARNSDLIIDLMVNHVSRHSTYFADFLEHGEKSRYAQMFIPPSKIWADGEVPEADLERIFLRRKQPFSVYPANTPSGTVTVWTSFGKQDPSEQVDVDVSSPTTREFFADTLKVFSQGGARMVRLDAIAYVTKRAGTSCFFVEPEIYEFLEWIQSCARGYDIELLPELHAHHRYQKKLAERGFWVYDFILPFLVLECIMTGNGEHLAEHLRGCPRKQITTLDCHDGVPVKPDLDDLVPSSRARAVVEECEKRGAMLSRVYSNAYQDPDGFDVHQIIGTYYSLLGADDDAYIAARAIQLFSPGVPQIYYVGLLAGENDPEWVRRSADRREVNRHNYAAAEVEDRCGSDVVKRLMRMIRLRNQHAAFDGVFAVRAENRALQLGWRAGGLECSLDLDLSRMHCVIRSVDHGTVTRFIA